MSRQNVDLRLSTQLETNYLLSAAQYDDFKIDFLATRRSDSLSHKNQNKQVKMTLLKEQLSDFKEKYEKAEQLVEEDSKHDLPSEPYKSHYSAYEILAEIQRDLKDLIDGFVNIFEEELLSSDSDADTFQEHQIYLFILGFVYKDMGRISVWTDDLPNAEKNLINCVELLENYKMRPECINAYIGALNQLGIVWSVRQDSGKSKDYFQNAEQACIDFKSTDKFPLSIYDVFGAMKDNEAGKGLDIFEKTYTLTLFYLAQIFGEIGDIHKSAEYCHTTLRRQLEYNDFEPIDWALNSATLSQYYFANDRNTEARHHLAAASYVLAKYEIEMIMDGMTEDEKSSILERFQHRSADVMRCWGKYGLNLLQESKNRLMTDDQTNEKPKTGISAPNLCRFDNIDVARFEIKISDQYCLMFDDAKEVFLAVQIFLKKAKEYYTSESEATEYAKIIQDLSSSYKALAFFEFDEGNQCKLHKRRADLLEDLIKIMNPVYYMVICRQLWYELGLIYTNMLDIKLDAFDRLKTQESPSTHATNKINSLCTKSIERFQSFIDSYKDKDTNDLQSTLTNDELVPIMLAYFQIGRLYYKLMTPNLQLQIENNRNSLKFYEMFVDACEEHKNVADVMKGEYNVCKEMISLLSLKIQKLENVVGN